MGKPLSSHIANSRERGSLGGTIHRAAFGISRSGQAIAPLLASRGKIRKRGSGLCGRGGWKNPANRGESGSGWLAQVDPSILPRKKMRDGSAIRPEQAQPFSSRLQDSRGINNGGGPFRTSVPSSIRRGSCRQAFPLFLDYEKPRLLAKKNRHREHDGFFLQHLGGWCWWKVSRSK